MNATPPFLLLLLARRLVLGAAAVSCCLWCSSARTHPECKLWYVCVCARARAFVFMHHRTGKRVDDRRRAPVPLVSHTESGHKLSLRSGAIFISSSFRWLEGVGCTVYCGAPPDDDAALGAVAIHLIFFRSTHPSRTHFVLHLRAVSRRKCNCVSVAVIFFVCVAFGSLLDWWWWWHDGVAHS